MIQLVHLLIYDNKWTNILSSITFFLISCRLWDHVEKYCRAGQDTDEYMAHAPWVLDTLGYKFICRLYNTYWFSTATTVAYTCLNVTLYVHCLPGYKLKSGGLCEKHEAATLTLEIHRALARAQNKAKKTVSRWLVAEPSSYWIVAINQTIILSLK
jgi:hypothetical protein